ncbi:MAG: DUF2384 domain-containing protein [Candidatus Rokubacteria bacterium]|nr:DUF2384 domain-containing protein [Candidatus Rokubacteria bacterium]
MGKKSGGSGTKRAYGRVVAPKKPAAFRSLVSTAAPAAAKIDAIRGGVNARVIDDMAAYLELGKAEVFKVLRTPESTAHQLIKDNRPLDAGASERVVRVADMTRLAEATFGGRDAARQWLKTPNVALANATPLSMLDTEFGAIEVRRILSAITHGGVL